MSRVRTSIAGLSTAPAELDLLAAAISGVSEGSLLPDPLLSKPSDTSSRFVPELLPFAVGSCAVLSSSLIRVAPYRAVPYPSMFHDPVNAP